jgi:peptidoglycan/LPS O-acetylase OafA/YrhL
MRGLAVLAVLVFHGGFSWASGGFLGVSTFFTLSGFLITTLLLRERSRNGAIGLKRFWARRFRRLMPAALVCLTGVIVFGATIATPAQLVNLRGDMVASLFYVANWRFIADGASYAELFAAPSPVLHFWSLAIEEQFYLVFPLIVAAVLAAAKGSRKLLAGILVAATVASIGYTAFLAQSNVDAAYYSTFSRAAELLLGALLAMLVALPATRRRLDAPRAATAVTAFGVGALLVVLWLWHTARQTDAWLYRGGLAAYAVLSTVLIVAAVEAGPMRRLFSNSVLRWLGRISYGAYLYHWPIFLWLTPARTGLDEWPLFALRMAVTLGAAVLSYHLIEEPIRAGRRITGWHPFVVAPIAVTLVLLGILRVTADPPTSQLISFDPVEQPDVPDFVASEAVAVSVPPTTAAPTIGSGPSAFPIPVAPPLPPPVELRPGEDIRLFMSGDSGMYTLAFGLNKWAQDTGGVLVWNAGRFGCGMGRGGDLRFEDFERPTDPMCNEYDWYTPMAEIRPHVAVLMSGTWDVVDRRLAGDDRWRSFGDPLYDQFIRQELTTVIDGLQSQGAYVVLMTHPIIQSGTVRQLSGPFGENDPERMRRYNQILIEVAMSRSRIKVFDLAGYMASRPNGELDFAERPDGIHWTHESSRDMAEWLGPQLEKLARGELTDPGTILWP